MSEWEAVRCDHDGVQLEGFLARPSGDGPFPAVLVMHSALGLRHQVGAKARELASLGYLAVATDMYGVDADTSTPEKAGEQFVPLTQDQALLRARCVKWFETVAALPDVDSSRIAAIGFCFGGLCVLELARSGVDAKAVVSYHGILKSQSPAGPGTVKAHVAAYCGLHDPYAPAEDIDALQAEMTAADASYEIMRFGDAAHSFTDPDAGAMGQPGIAYNAIADAVSWAGTLALFDTILRK
ncbi:MAG: dienelactone hydrolase family protein [Novosphingobium sp.]|nr:dienelactone hydrolase family protein [Novosphingobium sp.]